MKLLVLQSLKNFGQSQEIKLKFVVTASLDVFVQDENILYKKNETDLNYSK